MSLWACSIPLPDVRRYANLGVWFKAKGFFIFIMFTEKDLENFIFDGLRNPEMMDYFSDVFGVETNKIISLQKQFKLNGYGVADIVAMVDYGDGQKQSSIFNRFEVVIFELKIKHINTATIGQVERYHEAMKELLSHRFKKHYFDIRRILIGTSFNTNDDTKFVYNNSSVDAYIVKLDIEKGVSFDYVKKTFKHRQNFNHSTQFEFFVELETTSEMLFMEQSNMHLK